MPPRSTCQHSPFEEPEEPDHDDQPVGGAVLAGLQARVEPRGTRKHLIHNTINLLDGMYIWRIRSWDSTNRFAKKYSG